MPKKTIDMERARQALARLDHIAQEHPELLGDSTTDEWEETLTEVFDEEPTKEATVFTVKEVAELLKCHPETIKRAIRDGKLSAAKLSGRDWRISKADLRAYWRQQGGSELFGQDGQSE